VADPTSFELSRIYAAGWKAGREALARNPDEVAAAAEADSLNPYQTSPERDRWGEGFEGARLRARKR
jgi:hypothetical protein